MSDDPVVAPAPVRAKPESLRGRTLTASLTVKDLERSLSWYVDVVGFTVDRRFERDAALTAVSLKAGRVRLLITQDDGGRGWDRVKGEGMSLQITTVQNVDEIAQRIRERGGVLESEPVDAPWGPRVFRVKDPDGFRITFSSES
ncbi:MAG TPA: VOC family protein [Gemmatimonadaceae bacterium]|jgi:uncharacterized glyoxalase superfamily protein PhnB